MYWLETDKQIQIMNTNTALVAATYISSHATCSDSEGLPTELEVTVYKVGIHNCKWSVAE